MPKDIDRSAKAQRFARVAEKRVNRVLDSLRLLGQCANRRTYHYTDDQVQRIFREVRRAVRTAEEQFREGKKKTTFKL